MLSSTSPGLNSVIALFRLWSNTVCSAVLLLYGELLKAGTDEHSAGQTLVGAEYISVE